MIIRFMLVIFQVEEEVTTQTNFTVKLLKFDEKQKVALIKEIKSLIEGMNLVQVSQSIRITCIIIINYFSKGIFINTILFLVLISNQYEF